jgi:hypothetical protein
LLLAIAEIYPDSHFGDLKSTVRSNAPQYLHAKWRKAIVDQLLSTMEREGKHVLFACLYCCPWFAAAHSDRQAKAKKNSLFFVYRTNTAFYLSHVSQHSKAYAESVGCDRTDEWLSGREIRWFICQILAGNNKYVQALFLQPEQVLVETDEWRQLLAILAPPSQFLTRKLLASCLGQALGAVAVHDPKLNLRARQKAQQQVRDKPTAENVMILSPDARTDVEHFCTALRLVQACVNICCNSTMASPIDVTSLIHDPAASSAVELQQQQQSEQQSECHTAATAATPPPAAATAATDAPTPCSLASASATISQALTANSVDHHSLNDASFIKALVVLLRSTSGRSNAESDALLFSIIMRLHTVVKNATATSSVANTVSSTLNDRIGEWLHKLRSTSFLSETIVDASLSNSDLAIDQSDNRVTTTCHSIDELNTLMHEIGKPLASFPAERILFVVEAGSRMYNLSTPTSDRDFVAIYAAATQDVLGCITWPKESTDNRGKNLAIEHCCYETRMFTEMLIKGNPNVIEMLFTNNASYAHPLWQQLVANRQRLLSESVLQQYVGWVITHMKLIGKSTHAGREGKLFYHCFHKLGMIHPPPTSVPRPCHYD